MGRWLREVHIADDPPGLVKTDIFERLYEQATDLKGTQRLLIWANQKIGALIITHYGFSYADVVIDLCHYGNGHRYKPVLVKLGFFDIDGAVITAIMVLFKP